MNQKEISEMKKAKDLSIIAAIYLLVFAELKAFSVMQVLFLVLPKRSA